MAEAYRAQFARSLDRELPRSLSGRSPPRSGAWPTAREPFPICPGLRPWKEAYLWPVQMPNPKVKDPKRRRG